MKTGTDTDKMIAWVVNAHRAFDTVPDMKLFPVAKSEGSEPNSIEKY